MGKKKSRYSTTYCKSGVAKGCRGKANVATMKDGMCVPCWQKTNAKSLNRRRGVSVPKRLERKLLNLPIGEWDELLPRF